MKTSVRTGLVAALMVAVLGALGPLGTRAAQSPQSAPVGDQACVTCHETLASAVVATPNGAALACGKCHEPSDMAAIPHTGQQKMVKGQVAANSRGCLSCHDGDAYAKTRHGHLGLACVACHDAHSPKKHGKVVADDTGALCLSCHEERKFKAKVTHKPVAGGDCGDCHAVHATDNAGLLTDPMTKTCLACHAKVKKTPHAAAGLANASSHPVGDEKPGIQDPNMPGQTYSCASCHFPHMSDTPRLLRFDIRDPFGFCQKCHRI